LLIPRTAVIKHNQALKAATAAAKMAGAISSPASVNKGSKAKGSKRKMGDSAETGGIEAAEKLQSAVEFQDQGFVAPRVLILCPFRSTARKVVLAMKEALGKNTTISKAAAFDEEFGREDSDDEEADDDNGEDDSSDNKATTGDWGDASGSSRQTPKDSKGNKSKKSKSKMPADWDALFNDNIDDDFKLGIQLNPQQGKGSGVEKGVYLRLFSDFYDSDVIVASPLGLKLAVENGSNKINRGGGNGESGSPTFDFLSSIELIILHQADVMYMQNWDHVEFILSQTNRMPTNDHGTDFSRVRPYFLEGSAARHRQVIVSTEYNTPGKDVYA
jgi:U3 small nucleolar RNA-associated protein 25